MSRKNTDHWPKVLTKVTVCSVTVYLTGHRGLGLTFLTRKMAEDSMQLVPEQSHPPLMQDMTLYRGDDGAYYGVDIEGLDGDPRWPVNEKPLTEPLKYR